MNVEMLPGGVSVQNLGPQPVVLLERFWRHQKVEPLWEKWSVRVGLESL